MIARARLAEAIEYTPQPGEELVFQPFPGFQTRACMAGEDEVGLGGAKGPGKTTLGVALATRQVSFPSYKAVLVRSTYGEVQELLDRAHAMYSKLPERPQWRGDDAMRRFEFPSGAYIAFGYMEDEKDAERWQGKEPNFFFWDEFGKAKNPRPYELMLGELRSKDPRVRCQAMISCNPGQRNHGYIKRRFVLPCGESGGRVFFKFTLPNNQVAYKSRRWLPGSVFDNPIYANDPAYIAQLMSMSERDRKYLLEGSWENPDGAAFAELDSSRHIIRPFRVPAHWPMYAGHDWGYAHPWVFVYYAVDEDGRLYVVDTVWGRQNKDSDIAAKIVRRAPLDRIKVVYAGSDVFNKYKARTEEQDAPSTAERYAAGGLIVTNANTDREQGYRTLRELLAWKNTGPEGTPGDPRLVFMDTPGNRRLYEQLEALVTDPDDPEDVQKVDANAEGEGGDDGYDGLRYAVHSRPRVARETYWDRQWSINDPDVLRAEYEAKKYGTWAAKVTKKAKRRSTMESYG